MTLKMTMQTTRMMIVDMKNETLDDNYDDAKWSKYFKGPKANSLDVEVNQTLGSFGRVAKQNTISLGQEVNLLF